MESLNERLEVFFLAYLSSGQTNTNLMKDVALKLLTEIREPKIESKRLNVVIIKGELNGSVHTPSEINNLNRDNIFKKIGQEIQKTGEYTTEHYEEGDRFREIYTIKTLR